MNALLTQQKQTRRSRLPLSQLIPGWVQVVLFGWMICWGNHPLPRIHATKVEYVAVGTARIDYSKSSPEQSDGVNQDSRKSRGEAFLRKRPQSGGTALREQSSVQPSGSERVKASYDAAGRETSESLSQGGNTNSTRNDSYSYKANGVAGAGKVATKTDPRGIVSSYSYDGFSRVSQISASDSIAGLTQNFSYDNDGQLLAVAQSYQNLSNPASTVKRTYDPYGNIATEQVFLNGTLKDTWVQKHDALGHRTSLTELNNPHHRGE